MPQSIERATYCQIKAAVLDAYFDFCRDLAVLEGRPHDEIMAIVEDNFENTYDRPVEALMLEVVLWVLNGRWHSAAEMYRVKARKMIDEIGLGNLVSPMDKSERELFCHDLEILRII